MAATTAAITSIAAAGFSTGMSFAQAGKQRRLQQEAEMKAQEAMTEARKKLEINVYEGLAIQKEPYELQREALLTQGASALQAGMEGEGRGAAATAGRVQMAQQAGQAQVRAAMGQEVAQLEQLTAAEESRLRDIGVQLDLGEAAGAQLAARDAAEARQQALQQGAQGIVQTAGAVANLVPLYTATQQARAYDKALKMVGGDFTKLKALYPDNAEIQAMDEFKFRNYVTSQPIASIEAMQKQIQGLQTPISAPPNTTGMGARNVFNQGLGLGLDILGIPNPF